MAVQRFDTAAFEGSESKVATLLQLIRKKPLDAGATVDGEMEVRIWRIASLVQPSVTLYTVARHGSKCGAMIATSAYDHVRLNCEGMDCIKVEKVDEAVSTREPRHGWEALWTQLEVLRIREIADQSMQETLQQWTDPTWLVVELSFNGEFRRAGYQLDAAAVAGRGLAGQAVRIERLIRSELDLGDENAKPLLKTRR